MCILAYSVGSVALIVVLVPILFTVLSIAVGVVMPDNGEPDVLIAIGVILALFWTVRF